MLTLQTELTVTGLTGREITDFLLDPDDERYRAWWPGTHLAFHRLSKGPEHPGRPGDRMVMDELVGSRHLRMVAEVVDAVPSERVVWRMRVGRVPLPVRVTITFRTDGDDVRIRHAITAGWGGPGRAVDPLWRLYFSSAFAREMDQHARTEFPLLRGVLRPVRPGRPDGTPR